MAMVVIESGQGITSLKSAAQKIVAQYNSDIPGKPYEMSVEISGVGLAISAGIFAANRYLSANGIRPWNGYTAVAMKSGSFVLFRWLR